MLRDLYVQAGDIKAASGNHVEHAKLGAAILIARHGHV
jgi:hypothetical protein